MANVLGKPFLWYLFSFLSDEGIKRAIIFVGYKKEVIIDYFVDRFKDIESIYSSEEIPLGSGGALKEALKYASKENVFVFNGDTFFKFKLNELYDFHLIRLADVTIALKQVEKTGNMDLLKFVRMVVF